MTYVCAHVVCVLGSRAWVWRSEITFSFHTDLWIKLR